MTPPPNRLQLAEQLEQVHAELSRRGITPADRDRLLAEQHQLRAQLTAARRYAATRPPYRHGKHRR